VYDITDLDSFNQCETFYKQEIKNNCKENIKVILVGNKTDLENKRKVSKEQGAKLAEENKYCFAETSCETCSNVASAFETIIIMTINDMNKDEEQKINVKRNTEKFKIIKDDNIHGKNVKKKCC
jgi:GTPase SAR1 family protein